LSASNMCRGLGSRMSFSSFIVIFQAVFSTQTTVSLEP
jgi:hypothetical protein